MESPSMIRDTLGRPLEDLRISVTDRCNLRCLYCMPLREYAWVDRKELLTFEEIERVARIFVEMGVRKLRLTGGEPLLRQDIEILIAGLNGISHIEDLSLTTNGLLLAEKAAGLKAAGLSRINVSLDTLQPERFRQIAQRGGLEKVLESLRVAKQAGFHPIKLNCVVERGVNDDEILDLVEFGRANDFPVRFIEYMDVGTANQWQLDRVVSKREILERVNARYPLAAPERGDASAPAEDFRFLDGIGEIGVIASVTEPFCGACSRARLTADGKVVTCLFADRGCDLKHPIRAGVSDAALAEIILDLWRRRDDRYSEDRFTAMRSPEGYKPAARRKMEMIVLGG